MLMCFMAADANLRENLHYSSSRHELILVQLAKQFNEYFVSKAKIHET
jgi:hypothetical protein